MIVIAGLLVPVSKCEVDEEFNGINHQTSHNGVFKIKVLDVDQSILEEIGGIELLLGGSYVTFGKDEAI